MGVTCKLGVQLMHGHYIYMWALPALRSRYTCSRCVINDSTFDQILMYGERAPAQFCPVWIMVHVLPTPTVDLSLIIPVAISGGWAWASHPRFSDTLASEYVYSAHEVARVVRSYGRNLSRQVYPQEAERFAVLARGRTTNMLLARDEWAWTATHTFEPTGDPWVTWQAAAKVYFLKTGRIIERQRFRSRLT